MELYVHIPFCARKCGYCDFLSMPAGDGEQRRYMEALLEEVRQVSRVTARPAEAGGTPALPPGGGPSVLPPESGQKRIRPVESAQERDEPRVTSVFIGGGTPSLPEPGWIEALLAEIRAGFSLEEEAEITMEANPGTLSAKKLRRYRTAGINRLSMGVQSMDDRELERIGRIHTREEFLSNFYLAREAGFSNINVDLMSALPGQTTASWEMTLRKTAELGPEHISAYSLILEEGTPFWELYGSRPWLLPSEEEDREMYHRTKAVLEGAGYERYEISNYARPGRECIHNIGYWTRVPYLGLGLGAASFYGGRRFSNTREMTRYLAAAKTGDMPDRIRENAELLTQKDAMEEFMFLGLRLTRGIREEDFRQAFGRKIEEIYGAVLDRFTKEGLLLRTDAGWRLSEWGLDVSNTVLAEFLLEDGQENG